MRTQLTLVITALGLCHLLLLSPMVISQALAQPDAVNPQTSVPQSGNCHLVLTAPPVIQKQDGQKQNGQKQSAEKQSGATASKTPTPEKQPPKVAISESQPVEVTARECEKNNNVYSLTGDVEIKFEDYDFHGDMITYDADSGEVTTTGNASLDGG